MHYGYVISWDISKGYGFINTDDDAKYIEELSYDMAQIKPVVALPHTVDNVKPISEVAGIEIDQFLLGTCTNGRLSDLKVAADILDGKQVAKTARLLVLPASKEVYEKALDQGIIKKLSIAEFIEIIPTFKIFINSKISINENKFRRSLFYLILNIINFAFINMPQ